MLTHCKLFALSWALNFVLGRSVTAADKAPRIAQPRSGTRWNDSWRVPRRAARRRLPRASGWRSLATARQCPRWPLSCPMPSLLLGRALRLEAIPVLRPTKRCGSATTKLHGRLLVAVINSLGVRQDAKAVELLIGLLKDDDHDAAAAAAVALGHIGGERGCIAASRVVRAEGSPLSRRRRSDSVRRARFGR